jgi:lipopolysaccharide/colanic/teichoic acid biosynthesis glycosyltransferase
MAVFPIILDSKPEYLEGTPLSLLQLPLGDGTLLTYFGARLRSLTGRPIDVLRTFSGGPGYDAALTASGIVTGPSIGAADFSVRITSYEPSDWLLIVDARYFAVNGFDASPLFGDLAATPRLARHLIALEQGTAGTSERVELDGEGRVRRVQRYYDAVTWTVTCGVSCSLVPVSALTMIQLPPFESVAELRRSLSTTAVPSRDVPITTLLVDLSSEHALLAVHDRLLAAAAPNGRRGVIAAPTATVHSKARVVGNVIVHDGAEISEGAVVIGPAVIGAGACVERGALVAQCVVAPGVTIPAGAVFCHRIVTGADSKRGLASLTVTELLEDAQLAVTQDPRPGGVYRSVKGLLEAAVAIAALVVLSPLFVLVALLVKLDSKGPVLYGDPREAKDGKEFRCFKFRTMRVGADAAQRDLMAANQVDGPQFKMDVDPRVTRIGRWLRMTSIDELPQLLNVAMGQMSLVGPRPSPFRENQTCVPWREARLSVRPGITGLWQVCRHERQQGDFHQWIYYDIQYVRHMSFLVDLKIILATFVTRGGKGHVPLSWIISPAKEHA